MRESTCDLPLRQYIMKDGPKNEEYYIFKCALLLKGKNMLALGCNPNRHKLITLLGTRPSFRRGHLSLFPGQSRSRMFYRMHVHNHHTGASEHVWSLQL
jgi:hypothetical protein